MRSSLTTADRVVLLLALVPYLEEHGPTPIPELADAFDVEPALLRTLIRFLGTAGVPGETLSYQHEDLFDIDWTALEEHDIASLTRIVAVDDAPRFAPTETAALIAGLQALTGLLPETDAEVARRTAEKLGAALGASSHTATVSVTADPQDSRVAVVISAMRSGLAVGFEYRDAVGADTRRTVEPLHLSQLGGVWYLRGFCRDREGERTFRIDRMSGVTVLESAAAHSPRPGGTDEGPSQPEAGGAVVTALVREGALRKIATFGPETVGDAEVQPGWVRVRVETGHSRAAVALVQQAPGEVRVEAPEAAVRAVREWAECALAQYDA